MISSVSTTKAPLIILLAIIISFISAKFFVQGSAIVALPWGLLAILVSILVRSKREALILGGVLGFVISYSYLWFDYDGAVSFGKVVALTFLMVLPALFGLISGIFCAWIGWRLRKIFFKSTIK
jgi:hypothetical protein